MSDERRFTAALSDPKLTSEQLGKLVEEAETALVEAELKATQARAAALDPVASPDAAKAKAAMEQAAFNRDRLKMLLPRLDHQYQQLSDAEEYKDWLSDAERHLPTHNNLVEELQQVYRECEARLAPLLRRIAIADAIAHEIMSRKPTHLWLCNGDGKDFPRIEAAARPLDGAALGCRIMEDLRLPSFDKPNLLAWPPEQNSPFHSEVREAVRAFFPHDAKRFGKQEARVERRSQKFTRQQAEQAAAEAERRAQAEQAAAQAAADARQRWEQQEAARIRTEWGTYPGSPT